MIDVCDNTSVEAIGNGFVEVSCTDRKLSLLVFDDDMSNKSIPIYATVFDLPNGTIIEQLNYTPIPHGGAKSLFSTTKYY